MRAPIVILSALALPAAAQDCDWQQLPSTTPAFSSFKVVYDPIAARTLAVGVLSSQLQVWSYTPEAGWTQLTVGGPPPLSEFGLAFDSARNRLVLFGGFAFNAPYPETREWDGSAWTTVATSGPSVRGGAAMVYDAARAQTLLFGGSISNTPYLGDTWTWTGSQWLSHSPAAAPTAQPNAPVAYDPLRARVQLLSTVTGTLWEWTGQDWIDRAIASPPASPYPALFFNPIDQQLMLVSSEFWFGAYTVLLREAIGSAWTIRTSSGPQVGLQPARVVFDETRGVALQFAQPGIWKWNPDAKLSSPGVQSLTEPQTAAVGSTVQLHVAATGTEPRTYQWSRNGTVLTNTPPYSGVESPTLTISPWGFSQTGSYRVRISNACGSTTASTSVIFDSQCYANCDRSTVVPFLNVGDFSCFLGAVASGSSYANCDNSTIPPIINVHDYMCFLNAFFGGCSAP